MTLLVAGVDGKNIWMVADTAITGGKLEIRDREYAIKKSSPRVAAERCWVSRATFIMVPRSLNKLQRSQTAKKLWSSCTPATGKIRRSTLHTGMWTIPGRIFFGPQKAPSPKCQLFISAFAMRLRISNVSDTIPRSTRSLKAFPCSLQDRELPIRCQGALSTSITSMLRLFAERHERDVGGWPVPYHLTSEGAFLCGYGYSVSDPILTQIGPGLLVPHGTAEAGGFGLSVTELGKGEGVVVYWHQQPGGTVFRRTADGYEVLKFEGNAFTIQTARVGRIRATCRDNVLVDQPAGPPASVTVMRDERGVPCMALVRHGDAISFSVLNVGSQFRSNGTVNLKGTEQDNPGGLIATDRVAVTLDGLKEHGNDRPFDGRKAGHSD